MFVDGPKAKFFGSSAFILLAAAIAAPASGQSVLLRMNPDEGLVSRYVMNMEMHLDSPMMSSDKPFMTGAIYTTQTVIGTEGEVVEYRVVTDSANIQTPAMPMAQGQIPDQTGQTQTVKIDTRGRVVDMADEGASPEVQELMGRIGGVGLELPEKEVSPGDTWTATIDFGAPGLPGGGTVSMQIEMTYTLTDVSTAAGTRLATITFTGPVVMSGEGSGMGMDATGTASGSLVVDVAKGRLADTDMTMSLDMNAGGMAMSMNQTMKTTLIS